MHRRKSFLFRLFALLFALLLLITASVELALYHYARQVVGQEYIRLNQAGLRQISYTLGQGMTDRPWPSASLRAHSSLNCSPALPESGRTRPPTICSTA